MNENISTWIFYKQNYNVKNINISLILTLTYYAYFDFDTTLPFDTVMHSFVILDLNLTHIKYLTHMLTITHYPLLQVYARSPMATEI